MVHGASSGGSLHIVLFDSWYPSPAEGSGTAVGVRGLLAGLDRLGHRVEVVRPTGYGRSLGERIAFNLDLPRRLEGRVLPDLVVGIDLDGFHWARARGHAPRYVTCLKGVAADEARFERDTARAGLEAAARFERLNASRADRVIVPSRYSATVAARAYGIDSRRIAVVPEPVDVSNRVDPSATSALGPRPTGAPTILSVAHQYPRKDSATLLRAMAILLRDTPEALLRVVGDGPTLEGSKALAHDLGIGHAVTFLGAVSDDRDVAREYARADVFCLPSRQEGFGIVFAEAMVAGLPVVAARAGAVPEVVEDGETGFLVPPGEPADLAAALRALLGDRDLATRFGAAGMNRARRYDLEPVARAFLAEAGFDSA